MLEIVLVAAALVGLVCILAPSRPAERPAEARRVRPFGLHAFVKSMRSR